MTGLEDRNNDNLVNMICGIYCENNPFIKIENIKEEILSHLKRGSIMGIFPCKNFDKVRKQWTKDWEPEKNWRKE